MKTCTTCNIKKELTEFNFVHKKDNRRRSVCRDCQKKVNKAHYVSNRQSYIEKNNNSKKLRIARNREYIWNYFKEHPCVDCGIADPIVLEFDHIENKRADISTLICDGSSLDRIKEEISKCEVRCANCHRTVTYIRANNWRVKKSQSSC